MGWFGGKKDPLLDIESGDHAASDPTQTSVYQDGRRMLDVAMAMYLLPELREAVKNGSLDSTTEAAQRIVSLPCTPWDLQQLFLNQHEKLVTSIRPSDCKVYESALSAKAYTSDAALQEQILKSTEIIELDDTQADTSLVYGIAVSHLSRRLYVVFRGSVTVRDFLQDAKMSLGTIRNSANRHVDAKLPLDVGVHSGFREYLYDQNSKDESSKFSAILDKIKELVKQYPNYMLYIGGHSLGGALATLLAFEAACIEEIPKPVMAIPVAAPKVGNKGFLISFEELEARGKLRCLHIANDRDVVTLSPSNSALFSMLTLFCQNRIYRHVGIHLVLSPDVGTYKWEYPPKVRNWLMVGMVDMMLVARRWLYLVICYPVVLVMSIMCCCLSKRGSLAEEHSCETYMDRFDQNQSELEKITVEDVYRAREERAWWRTSGLSKRSLVNRNRNSQQ